ncbi:MAG: hypothetical protein B6247_28980, partial [Candidatus Parabeggiatoa sp. nov. 2]
MTPPVSAWGTKALVSDLPNGAQYRILAAEDDTSVSQDGSPVSRLAAGKFHFTGTLSGNHVFEADKPILVAAFMEGGGGMGDPAMGSLVPPEQFLNRYTFSTIGGGLFSRHHLQVIVDNTETGTITLDGSPIGAGKFVAIGGTGYSVATIPLPEGSHNTASNLGHGIFVIGLANFNSYLYPGGTQLGGIIIGNDTPVAANVSVGGTPVVNSALTVSYTYSDTEGDLEGASSFQWLVASDAVGTHKVAIPDATNKSYRPTVTDFNKYITVEVTPVAQTGTTVGTPVEASFVGPVVDNDGDGIPSDTDNCPADANADQANNDGDALGDVCDTDDDNDGVKDGADNCPLVVNADQTDTDGDGAGDACDTDDDNDGVKDGADNCPLVINADQTDTDGDGAGDACDTDDDNDGVKDGADNCPLVVNAKQTDTDGDGAGDACDTDDDNDAVKDGADNCPLVVNAKQTDTDGDGAGDACDTDDDNDAVKDGADNCPLVANAKQTDT